MSTTSASAPPRSGSSIRALSFLPYAQLIRLPNVFTAFADICLGALAVQALPDRWLPFGLVLLASGCLYSAGMVWNDFFDYQQDYHERPIRPLPSGKISRRTAAFLGAALLMAGVLFASLAGFAGETYRSMPLVVAVVLVVCILGYDAWLKHTPVGPAAMGSCRLLNVLLGLSAGAEWPGAGGLHLALVVGLYIAGVTLFARTEARMSKQGSLTAAAFVILVALVLVVPVPASFDPARSSVLFPYLLVVLGFFLGVPVWQAIAQPTPERVQAAVKQLLMGLVILDAVLASGVVGEIGLAILLLLLPALYLGRWVYST